MEEVKIDILSLLPPDEGEIDQYYGRIGSGKTYAATADILKQLKKGKIIYANWRINFEGYDQRKKKFWLLLGLLGLKKNYLVIPKENLHWFPVKDTFTEDLGKLNDCKVYLDEGHIAFDSYVAAKMSLEKRAAVLHTRHYDRSIIVISQRPTAIHVSLRANVNRFFKCEKTLDLKIPFTKIRWQIFKKTEFQDTLENDAPNEKRKQEIKKENGIMVLKDTDEYEYAISVKRYFGRKKIFQAYDTKYRREGMPTSQPNYAQVFHMTYLDKIKALGKNKNYEQSTKTD